MSFDPDRIEFARIIAHAAAYAERIVNDVRHLLFSRNAFLRAIALAEGASRALLGIDDEGDQSLALFRRAFLVVAMRLLFGPEVPDGCQHRVRSGLAEA